MGFVALVVLSIGSQSSFAQEDPTPDIITEMSESGAHSDESLSEWRALRRSIGLDETTSWCTLDEGALARVSALRSLAADNLIVLERDFARRSADARPWSSRLAGSCDAALQAAESGDFRAAARLVAQQAGSVSSLLPAECFDDGAVQLAELDSLLEWERGLSYERSLGADEFVEAPPDGAACSPRETVLRSVGARMVEAPSWTTSEFRDGICSSDIGADWESMSRAPLAEMAPYRFVIEWVLTTTPPGDRTLLRMATYRYLATDAATLELLAEHVGDDSGTAASVVRALAAGARQDFGAMRDEVTGLEDSELRLARWTRAESLRHSESFDDAFAIASSLSSADAYYVPALFTQAAVQIALDQPDEALRDLVHLERIVEGDPIYEMWVARLAARLR